MGGRVAAGYSGAAGKAGDPTKPYTGATEGPPRA